jgi:glycosyltransferase involved in cell wall biosynthesis
MIQHSGVGTYVRGILGKLTQEFPHSLILFGHLEKLKDLPARKISWKAPIYSLKEQIIFPMLLRRNAVSLLHVPHYNIPLAYHGKLVITIHDLIHLRFPPSRMAYVYARTMLEIAVGRAIKILTVSQNTKQDLVEILNVPLEKIVVTPLSAENFTQASSNLFSCDKAMESSTLPFDISKEPYLLYVGNIKPLKNVPMLIRSFFEAKKKVKDLRLVCAGRNFMSDWTKQYTEKDGIYFLGEVSNARLRQLYKQSHLFVFPSIYEGFGLPPLEAMEAGVPVICSNAASLPEVVGDAAWLIDPYNQDSLTDAIIQLWTDTSERERLKANAVENISRFSWQKCADQTLDVYQEILK